MIQRIYYSIIQSVFIICLVLLPSSIVAQNFDAAEQLIKRRIPFLDGKVKFKTIPTDKQEDTFKLYTSGNTLTIEANSTSAATSAVNYYLNHFCHMSLSHNGDNLKSISKLPEIDKPVTINSPFRYRYALNYCTYNYTYSFYDWNDWERELDWMALNGVNLMLAPVGTEYIWQKTLSQMNFSDKEIRDFIPGPAFTAWWLMGNLEGWGGPVSDNLIERQMQLQKKILARMDELGIEPILQGFWGMVPNILKNKYPQAKIIDQGLWVHKYIRPAILLPEDPLFDKMAGIYYKVMTDTYGNDIKYFGGDLFHEGGSTKNIDVTKTATLIQSNMQKSFPGSKWVLQGWSGNPKKELLIGLNPEHAMVIDLFGENLNAWKATNEYQGVPWIWATVNHFGGKTDMGGQLPVIIQNPHKAAKEAKNLKGIGILPEGIKANPIVFDWALKTAWETDEPSVDKYLREYIVYRYGKWDENIYNGWKKLLESVYGEFEIKGEGTFESIFCARPGMEVTSVSTWGPKRFQYDPQLLVEALTLIRQSADKFGKEETFKYDIVDLSRQVLANYARSVYERSMIAFKNKDKAAFNHAGNEFLSILGLQDRLLATEKDFLVGQWLEKAKQFGGNNPEDIRIAELNARIQISYWGPDDAETELHDYANKEWSGLLSDYYLPRWKDFYTELNNKINESPAKEVDYYAMEKAWSEGQNFYPTEPQGNFLEKVDSVLSIVYPLYKNPQAKIEERVADLMNRMTLSEKIAQMRHIHFKHYDSDGKVDLEKLASSTNGLSYGCIEAFPYSSEKYLKAIYHIQKYMKEKTRLGIPVIPVMEGLHGMVQDGSTIYPQSIALGSTFNPVLVEKMSDHIAGEMKAIGTKQVLAPVLDIARELRWGRVEETFGEDPFLISKMGIAYVKGIHKHNLISTPKHYVAHGTPTAGLNLASVKGGKRELLDLYIKPFEQLIKQTNPLSIMNCYSSYDNEAVTGSSYLMTDLLRDSLKFKGYVYSDWGSIPMLSYFHRTTSKGAGAAKRAIEAGIDLEAGSDDYKHVQELVENNQLDTKYIDRAVYNILYAKFASGLFDDALPDTTSWSKNIHTTPSIEIAKLLADESAVLLENKNNILPLNINKLSSITIIGPNADQVQFGDYSWTANNNDGVTPLQGIKNFVGNKIKVDYAKGCDLYSQNKSGFAEAVKAASKSDLSIIFVGSQSALLARPSEPATSGEGYDLSDLKLPGVQQELIQEIKNTNKPFIVVLVTGKPFALPWIKENANALLIQWYAGEQAGNSIADILFGKVNPSGKLAVSFPQSVGHLPAYYNYLPTDKGFYNKKGSPDTPGRDYVFSNPSSLYPFGYGLSYTKFDYSNLCVAKKNLLTNETINVSVDIKNTGANDGKEVVQLYIRDLESSVVTPVKQLVGFEKISLKKGELKTITFDIPVSSLYLHDKNFSRVVEPGDFELMIGSSSDDILLKETVTVQSDNNNLSNVQVNNIGKSATVELGKELTIKGTVRNVQAAVMSGVKVQTSNSQKNVITDKNGKYTIKARVNESLTFTINGYTPQNITVGTSNIIDIDMIAEIK